MTAKKSAPTVNPLLEKFLNGEMKAVIADKTGEKFTHTQKMAVVDRVIKLEQIKHKLKDDGYGSGFHQDD